MTSLAIVIQPERDVAEAARLMTERVVNRLPVESDKNLVGIVTRADLVRVFVRSDDEIARELRQAVVADTLWVDPESALGAGLPRLRVSAFAGNPQLAQRNRGCPLLDA